MIKAFIKGLAQLNDPNIRKVFIVSIFGSAFIFIALWIAVGIFIESTRFSSIIWLNWVINLMGGLTTLILTWVLFPPVPGRYRYTAVPSAIAIAVRQCSSLVRPICWGNEP